MARTFSYQKQQRNRQQPPLRANWQIPRPGRNQRGTFADLADKVREQRQRITSKSAHLTTDAIDQQPAD